MKYKSSFWVKHAVYSEIYYLTHLDLKCLKLLRFIYRSIWLRKKGTTTFLRSPHISLHCFLPICKTWQKHGSLYHLIWKSLLHWAHLRSILSVVNNPPFHTKQSLSWLHMLQGWRKLPVKAKIHNRSDKILTRRSEITLSHQMSQHVWKHWTVFGVRFAFGF